MQVRMLIRIGVSSTLVGVEVVIGVVAQEAAVSSIVVSHANEVSQLRTSVCKAHFDVIRIISIGSHAEEALQLTIINLVSLMVAYPQFRRVVVEDDVFLRKSQRIANRLGRLTSASDIVKLRVIVFILDTQPIPITLLQLVQIVIVDGSITVC